MSQCNASRDKDQPRMYYTFDELQECADNDFKNLNVVKLAKTPPHEIGAWLERLSGEDHLRYHREVQKAADDHRGECSPTAQCESVVLLSRYDAGFPIEAPLQFG